MKKIAVLLAALLALSLTIMAGLAAPVRTTGAGVLPNPPSSQLTLSASEVFTQQVYLLPMSPLDLLPNNISGNGNVFAATVPSVCLGRTCISQWSAYYTQAFYVNGVNNAGNYWKIRFCENASSTCGTVLTEMQTYPNDGCYYSWCESSGSTFVQYIQRNHFMALVRVEKVGTPGNLWLAAPNVTLYPW